MLEKGTKVNYLTLISNEIKKENNKYFVYCECKCGNKKWILKNSFVSKRIRDCGCGLYMLQKHIGEKHNYFTIIDCYRKRLNGKINIVAICKCECGNLRHIPVSNLNKDIRISCGCKDKFNFEKYRNKIYNNIQILELVDETKKTIKCLCNCGNIFTCNLYDITSKKNPIISCSKCFTGKMNSNKKFIHKEKIKLNRLKSIFSKMIDRCYNEKSTSYRWYGAKGVKIYNHWLEDYNEFEKWSMQNGYNETLSIDRIDYDGNYEPNNCRWVDMITQQNNRKNNIKFEFKGQLLTLPQIARAENFNVHTLITRIRTGMSLDEALTKPIKKR